MLTVEGHNRVSGFYKIHFRLMIFNSEPSPR